MIADILHHRWEIVVPDGLPLYREVEIVEPLRFTHHQDWVLRDIFDPRVPLEILEEVFYVMQRAKHHRFLIPTAHPSRISDFAQTVEMAALMMRNNHIHYIATDRLAGIANAPLRNREVQVQGDADLGAYLPHDFSVATTPGKCELCGDTLRGPLHGREAVPRLSVVRCADPSEYLWAQCDRGRVFFTTEVF